MPYKSNIYIENQRAILKPFTVMDIEYIRPIFYNKVLEYFELVLNQNSNVFDEYINYLIQKSEDSSCITFTCYDKQIDKYVGITQLKYIDLHNKKLEIGGTWYGKSFQGTGFNYACKQALFQFCFDKLDIRRIQFSIDVDNIASQKSITKLGAKKEGLLRNNWVDTNGTSRNDYYYSIINQDWNIIKNTIFKDLYLI